MPAATCARNSSGVIPAPIFFCSGRRRLEASTMRDGAGEFDALRDGGEHQDELIHHKAGIDAGADQRDAPLWRPRRAWRQAPDACETGRPVPRRWKRRSSPRRGMRATRPSRRADRRRWYESRRRRASPSTLAASAETVTPQGASFAPTTSPRSRPALAGSLSMAPTISIECFCRISRTIEAPMGPTPNCTARIFFFTGPSLGEK